MTLMRHWLRVLNAVHCVPALLLEAAIVLLKAVWHTSIWTFVFAVANPTRTASATANNVAPRI